MLVASVPAWAQDEPALKIQLNKTEDADDGGCRAVFVFDNRTGYALNRLQVDLILFDAEGVYSKQVVLDMAPLTHDKKVLASFVFADHPCGDIGSILVNDIPQCRNGAGTALDCVDLLKTDSRSVIPLEK